MRGEPTGEVGAEVEVVRRGLPGRSRAVRVKEAERADRVKEADRAGERLGLPGLGRSRDDRVKEAVALTGEGGGWWCDIRDASGRTPSPHLQLGSRLRASRGANDDERRENPAREQCTE